LRDRKRKLPSLRETFRGEGLVQGRETLWEKGGRDLGRAQKRSEKQKQTALCRASSKRGRKNYVHGIKNIEKKKSFE